MWYSRYRNNCKTCVIEVKVNAQDDTIDLSVNEDGGILDTEFNDILSPRGSLYQKLCVAVALYSLF